MKYFIIVLFKNYVHVTLWLSFSLKNRKKKNNAEMTPASFDPDRKISPQKRQLNSIKSAKSEKKLRRCSFESSNQKPQKQ